MRWILRLAIVGAMAAGTIAATGGTAAAGGWTWIELDRGAYARGETVSSRVRFWILPPKQAWSGDPEDGPYRVYLLREDAWIDPPDLPAFAVPLAEVRISDPGNDREPPFSARFAFEVPDVPVGRYSLGICNVPCTKTLGDVGSGHLFIAETPVEARLVELIDRVESSLRDRLRARTTALGSRLRADERSIGEDTAKLEDRIVELEERLEAAERPTEVTLPQPVVGDLPAIGLAAAILALAGAIVIRGRRRATSASLAGPDLAVRPDEEQEEADGPNRGDQEDPIPRRGPIDDRIHVS